MYWRNLRKEKRIKIETKIIQEYFATVENIFIQINSILDLETRF